MRFFSLCFALVAVANAANTIINPELGYNIYAPESLPIKWTPDTPGPVTLTLRFGAANSLAQGTQIAKSIPNSGSFSWPIPASFGSGIYTVEIKDDKTSAINYSPLFSISGGLGIQGTTISLPGSTATPTKLDGVSASSAAPVPTSSHNAGEAAFKLAGGPLAAVLGLGALIIV